MKTKEVKSTLRCKAKKFAACTMSTLMLVSAMNVGGWGRIEVKAEETGGSTALSENVPESLAIYDDESGTWEIDIIKDGVLQDDGVEHTHNTDGNVTYTWKDDNDHIKEMVCKDCPIGYVTKETETHSIGENGFCASNNVYQPADLTTDKYDIDGDGSEDAVYEISNAGQLFWFAGLVNGTLDGVEQNTSANAILMKDITVNENLLDSLQYDTEGNVSNGSDFIS